MYISGGYTRRDLLAPSTALLGWLLAHPAAQAQVFSRSLGLEAPTIAMPPGATDCHLHLFAPGYPVQTGPTVSKYVENATLDDHIKIRQRLGLTRSVLVQPSTYGADNTLLLDALERLGETARGVAVIVPSTTKATLQQCADRGVRGIRFNLVQAGTTTVDMVEQLARRVAPLGWHCSFYVSPELLIENIALFERLPTTVVFEHNAALASAGDPAAVAVRRLLDKGNTWVKLTSAIPNNGQRDVRAQGFLGAARMLYAVPDRIVWGSDWPHVGAALTTMPDDAFNLDLLGAALGGSADLQRVLTDNPAKLYGFPPS